MTVLEKLEEASIFNVALNKDKTRAEFVECCDYYFSTELDKKKFGILIAELQFLHDQMEDCVGPRALYGGMQSHRRGR